MKKLKIGILSTLNTNIGDEFIRDGILSVIQDILQPDACELTVYNKHQPWTFYPSYHPARLAGVVDSVFHRGWRKGLNFLSHIPGNLFCSSDLILQSGTPIIWENASKSEWATPFWRNVVFKNYTQIPVLNIGGGSCYAWSKPPDTLNGDDREFACRMVQNSVLTTCREPLAAKLLSEASGEKIAAMECPGFLAGQVHESPKPSDGRILVNAMPIGGHFDYMKQVDPDAWRKTLDEQIQELKNEFCVEFVCHNENEVAFVSSHWPTFTRHHPREPSEYFRICVGAHAAIVNRLHAAVGLSGLGIPCIAMGTDTRLLMTRQIGIPSLFVPEVTHEQLSAELQKLLADRENESQRLLENRATVFERYRALLHPHLTSVFNKVQKL
ncbi:MAG: polysaccharide pyruvyl transferase family protein [Kiritimatiellae bacterium]|jgi:hypothetical protein|nr:polysaccharide pyruvyl transferase family protein [Kiritimatiellia bacterium]